MNKRFISMLIAVITAMLMIVSVAAAEDNTTPGSAG